MAETSVQEIIRLMVGREVTDVYPKRTRQKGEVLFEVDRLVGWPKPRGVSFDLWRGEILGLAGLVGAGRTETVRTAFGLDRMKSGTVVVKGQTVPHPRPRGQIRAGVGFLSEDRNRRV